MNPEKVDILGGVRTNLMHCKLMKFHVLTVFWVLIAGSPAYDFSCLL